MITKQTVRFLLSFILLCHYSVSIAQFFTGGSTYGQESPDPRFNETDYLWSAEPAGFDPSLSEKGELLIITTNEFARELSSFIKWKKQLGRMVYTESVDDIGNEPQIIKQAIDHYYYQFNVRYVLIIGDSYQVSPMLGTIGNVNGAAADPMYGLVDQDIYPDIFVSRIPSNNSKKLRVALNKIIRYERAEVENTSWYSQAIALGSDEGGGTYYDLNDQGDKVQYEGMKDRDIAKELAEKLAQSGYHEISQLFDTAENGLATKDRLIDELNQGAGLVYYLGHGVEYEWKTTHFNNYDISRLQNKNMTPVIISVACLNGNFEWLQGDSFAENWINSGTEEEGTGAVAILASTTVQPWTPPTVGIREMIDSIVTDRYETLGGIFTNGIIKFLRKKRKQIIETFQSWHIFGDATVLMRTEAPVEIYYSIDEEFENLESLNFTAESGITVTALQGPKLLARSANNQWQHLNSDIEKGPILVTLSGKNRFPVEINYHYDGSRWVKQ